MNDVFPGCNSKIKNLNIELLVGALGPLDKLLGRFVIYQAFALRNNNDAS